jgi:CBS domain-containing protein
MKVKEIMVKEVATLDVNDELSLANDIMRLGRIRHLPVVDGTRLVGIVSERDLFRSSLAHALGYASKDTRDLMKTLHIKDVMVTGVITIPPDTEVCEATKMMVEEKIGCLPVVEGNRLVGLITETDVLLQYIKECGKG